MTAEELARLRRELGWLGKRTGNTYARCISTLADLVLGAWCLYNDVVTY